jgi:cytochrome oxidase assembly protein ShyY1
VDGVWRTALKPRWLALLAAVLVLSSGMAWLGTWQLGRARDQGDAAKQARVSIPPVPLRDVLPPQTAFPADGVDRPVTVTGSWERGGQLLLPERWLDGRQGFWVLTPLRLDDGSVLAVLRGWTASAADAERGAAALPTTPVSLTGVLRPGEEAVTRTPGETSGLPAGQLERVDPVELIERWSGPTHTGFVVLTAPEQPGLTPVPPATGNGRLALQNLSYAVQWFIFAGFGLFLWFRLVRDDHRGLLGARVVEPAADQAGLGP